MDFGEGIAVAWELGVRKFVTEFWYTGNTSESGPGAPAAGWLRFWTASRNREE